MLKILISACLLGEKVRYDGKDCLQSNHRLQHYIDQGCIIAFCPEVAGGLSIPRLPAEIEPTHHAKEVLAHQAKVLTQHGDDVSQAYCSGAKKRSLLRHFKSTQSILWLKTGL